MNFWTKNEDFKQCAAREKKKKVTPQSHPLLVVVVDVHTVSREREEAVDKSFAAGPQLKKKTSKKGEKALLE